MLGRNKGSIIGAAVAVFLFSVPTFIHSNYLMHIFITMAINIIMAITLAIVLRTGQLSLGHAAFLGVGAYSSSLFVMRLGLSFWAALPLSGITSAIVAIIIGYPTLRLRGIYFAIATFAVVEVMRSIWSYSKDLFGGPGGIFGIPVPDPIFGITFSGKTAYYYLALIMTLIVILVLYNLERSQYGMSYKTVGNAEKLSQSVGINITKYKLQAFVISAFFAGVAGSFYAHYMTYISPSSFTIWGSINYLMFVVVGGTSIFWGPIAGTVFLSIIGEMLYSLSYYKAIILGGILLAVILFFPEGLSSLPKLILRKDSHRLYLPFFLRNRRRSLVDDNAED